MIWNNEFTKILEIDALEKESTSNMLLIVIATSIITFLLVCSYQIS